MDVSAAQLAATAEHEGFSAKAYKDGVINGVQMYSIGFGHQIQPNEQNLRAATITRAKGLELFKKDGKTVVDFINANTKNRRPNQNQFDAFFDYGYNAGTGGLRSSVLNLWNAGASVEAVAEAIRTTRVTAAGKAGVNSTLVSRRAVEAARFATPYLVPFFLLIGVAVYAYLYWQTNYLEPLVAQAKELADDAVHLFV